MPRSPRRGRRSLAARSALPMPRREKRAAAPRPSSAPSSSDEPAARPACAEPVGRPLPWRWSRSSPLNKERARAWWHVDEQSVVRAEVLRQRLADRTQVAEAGWRLGTGHVAASTRRGFGASAAAAPTSEEPAVAEVLRGVVARFDHLGRDVPAQRHLRGRQAGGPAGSCCHGWRRGAAVVNGAWRFLRTDGGDELCGGLVAEESARGEELSQDTAERPDVDPHAVRQSQEHLGRAVGARLRAGGGEG
eukprot:scaffold4423_cov105-Isochrysis_galbana.AAC.8